MNLVVTLQVEENYGAHGVDSSMIENNDPTYKPHWKPKGGVQWVFPIRPQTMFWMWDDDVLRKKLGNIAVLESSMLFRYTVLDYEFMHMVPMDEYDMEEIMEQPINTKEG